MKLSIVVPAYNEESRIRRMLDAYVPYFAGRYGGDVEVLVVVNGSSDGTAAVVQDYATRAPIVRCLVEPRNVGKGGALIEGFQAARGDWIGFVDADGATPPPAFDDLVLRIGDAAAIIASRWTPGAQVSPPQPLTRRVASRLFNLQVRLFFGMKLSDTQCGAKLMRRDVLMPLIPHFGITRWAFDVDLLYQIHRGGGRIVETPTTWSDVAGSKLQVGRASLQMFLALVRLRLLYSPLKWIVRLYHPNLIPMVHLPKP